MRSSNNHLNQALAYTTNQSPIKFTPNNDQNGSKDQKKGQEFSTQSTFNDRDKNKAKNTSSKTPLNNYLSADETEAQEDELIHSIDPQVKQQISEQRASESTSIGEADVPSIQKKPNFSVVCMLPTNGQLIDPETLKRIIQIQQQYLLSQKVNFNTGVGGMKSSRPKLQMEKIGVCGVPSLWMTKEELIKEKHVTNEVIFERDRLDHMLRILQIHKKYENEKYFGGTGLFKRGGQYQLQLVQNSQSSINPEFVQFSTDTLIQRQKGQNREDKINSLVKDDNASQNEQVFPQIRNYDNPEQLLFRILQAEAKLVRMILESHGFIHTESNDWNILWTCTSSQQKSYMYESLNENQKINHFINSSELTRKDRLCFNVGKMQIKFGKNHFDFLPETYILPDEFSEFYKAFNQHNRDEEEDERDPQSKNIWIVKPSASSQGKGIFMVDDISEVPLNESLVISRYISNPLLINGLKFDLRLYVLVTNFDPLKIYIYNEGLVRFASEPYNSQNIKQNVYAHLTNYSINKKSEYFVQNKNIAQRDVGNKWSLSALQIHLIRLGIDMKIVWERIYDAIIKSIISVENHTFQALKKIQNINNQQNKSNSFDLFGFDIILDSDLKPWILEVNLSPSLAFESPLDFHIKSNLLVDAFNIVGIKKFSRRRDFMGKQLKVKNTTAQNSTGQGTGFDQKKRFSSALNVSQIGVQSNNILNKTADNSGLAITTKQQNQILDQVIQKNQYDGIDLQYVEKLSKVSAKHRELLREHLEEFSRNRKNNFTRIYPAPGSNNYDNYFEQPRQLNKLLYKYLYQPNDLADIISQINRSSTLKAQYYQEPAHKAFDSSPNATIKEESYSPTPISLKNNQNYDINDKQNRPSSMSSLQQNSDRTANIKVQTPDIEKPKELPSRLKPDVVISLLSKRKLEEKRSQTTNKQEASFSKQNSSNLDKDLDSSLLSSIKPEDKVVITGDDILIEYVRRTMNLVKQLQVQDLTPSILKKLDQFLTHKVWYSKTQQNRQADQQQTWQRIESKCIEMQERKKRLFIKRQQKEGSVKGTQMELQFNAIEKQKQEIIKEFTSQELEQMLIQSNKNNQIEVVSILLYGQSSVINGINYNSGILTKLMQIEKETQRLSKNNSQLFKLLKVSNNNQSSQNGNDFSLSHIDQISSPKSINQHEAQVLTRMRTSEEKYQTTPFNYKTHNGSNYEQLHNSTYSQQNSGTGISQKADILYQSSHVSSNQNLQQPKSSSKKGKPIASSNLMDRDFSIKQSDNKITLPQINSNHLSQDYSRVSIQLNNANEINEKHNKYRNRMQNERQGQKKIRQQSLQTETKESSAKTAKLTANTKFERIDI